MIKLTVKVDRGGFYTMKRFIVLLVFILGATNATLADHYTVDKRKYVSDGLWATEPYKYVVRLFNEDGGGCTGNLVGSASIVTAAHCNRDNNWVGYDGTGGHAFPVFSKYVEKYNKNEKTSNDYMVLRRSSRDSTNLVGNNNILGNPRIGNPITAGGVAKVLGFGCLKIMSDEEIDRFRNDYIFFLRDTQKIRGSWNLLGQVVDSNSHYHDKLTQSFISDLIAHPEKYRSDPKMFYDCKKLKERECFVGATDANSDVIDLPNCQGWGGDSGGGVYLNTAGMLRMTDQEYLNYLYQEQKAYEKSVNESYPKIFSRIDKHDETLKDLMDFMEVSSYEDLRKELEPMFNSDKQILDDINQEIQSVKSGKPNSNWQLIGVVSRGHYTLNRGNFAKPWEAASVKKIGDDAVDQYDYDTRHGYAYDRYFWDKFKKESERERSGVPEYLYREK